MTQLIVVTGEDMTFVKWAIDTPSNVDARCMSFIYDGDFSEWRDEECVTSQAYVCQYSKYSLSFIRLWTFPDSDHSSKYTQIKVH